jgi:hypothetical protein
MNLVLSSIRRAAKPTAVAFAAALCGIANAQSITPAQFIQACRVNPGNTVVLTEQTKFQTTFTGTTFATPTGCTVVLAPGASFELDTITMNFGGAFVVQGGEKAKVALDKATLTAPAVTLSLTGFEGQFTMNEARLTTTGNLALQFGQKGLMEVKNSGGWYQPRLAARGQLSLSAGAFFSGSVVQSGLQGAAGVQIALNGTDSNLMLENSDVLVSSGASSGGVYTTGPFSVTGSASKVSFSAINVNLMEASGNITMALNGAESKLGLKSLRSQTGSQRISLTAMGTKSEVNVESVLMYGIPEVIIESGAQGSTTVGGSPNTINSAQLIRARAGLGGSCSVNPQGLSAPTLQICR